MKNLLVKSILVLVIGTTSAMVAPRVQADEWPMTAGDFWEVTGIHFKDGGALAYTNWIVSEWKADADFAKSKGWIKSYMVLGNAYPRKGEPDVYLIQVSDHLASGPEGEKRQDEYIAWKKKSQAQMQKESGNRLEFREVGSNLLLQEWKFRK